MKRELWIEAAEALNFPTTGAFPEMLWRECSGNHGIPHNEVAQLYRDCGYIPFSGYPLARSGKIERMSRQDVASAHVFNPLVKAHCGMPSGYPVDYQFRVTT